MKLPILYARAETGAILNWEIEVVHNKFRSYSGQEGGATTVSEFHVCAGKNIGRANQTSPEEQASKEAAAKWEKKLKEGYSQDINKIDEQKFIQPMLANKFKDRKDKITYPVAIESKINGICCLIHKAGGFSRKGEQFFCIDHIKDSLKGLIIKYPKAVIHGELFNMEYKNLLNRIASLVSVNRKEKDINQKDIDESRRLIKFYVYDGYGFEGVTEETPFKDRKAALRKVLKGLPFIEIVDYSLASSEKEVEKALKDSEKRKEEGIMVKILDGIYEHKRSNFILKYKNFYDAEFKVLAIEMGDGNWSNKAKRIICELKKGVTFASNIKGTYQELEDLYKNREKYIGKFCTVVYQELSEYGVPLIPYTSLPFRDYE